MKLLDNVYNELLTIVLLDLKSLSTYRSEFVNVALIISPGTFFYGKATKAYT